jgi:cytochrome o ubiquinol oxidase subunit 2
MEHMTKRSRPVFYILLITGIILLLVLFLQPIEVMLFHADIDLLFPTGQIAKDERNLLFLIQAIMLLVIIPVYILTFIFSWLYRSENKKAKYDPDLVDNIFAEIVWWTVPLVLVGIISYITYIETHRLDPYKPIPSDKRTLEIEVVALQWKWLFIYPEEKIATVNYLEIPKDTPIHFKITADAPMNSFWIPDLGGQIYAMPGMQTELHLIGNKEAVSRGCSANISGEGFAGMHFHVRTSSEEDYKRWIDKIKSQATAIDFDLYRKIAAPTKNVPPGYYLLGEENLFSMIMMQYMPKEKKE